VIQRTLENVGFVAIIDTLKFLAEGGRVAEARQWMKSALRVYPILYIAQGQIRLIGLARTKPKAVERMVQWLGTIIKDDRVALAYCHTDAYEEASELGEKLAAMFRPVESFLAELTPVVGAHTGPGLIGVAWWKLPEI
jgi:DegV family protein with EDD domain